MKDVRGIEIKLGDKVAYSGSKSASVYVGEVTGFTAKNVRIADGVFGNDLKAPSYIAVVERNPAREEELKNPPSKPESI